LKLKVHEAVKPNILGREGVSRGRSIRHEIMKEKDIKADYG